MGGGSGQWLTATSTGNNPRSSFSAEHRVSHHDRSERRERFEHTNKKYDILHKYIHMYYQQIIFCGERDSRYGVLRRFRPFMRIMFVSTLLVSAEIFMDYMFFYSTEIPVIDLL